ncbi:SPRY and SOCS box domain containing protein [Trichuris trichiura]|uniref:SPRY and SOCS box domain containing protein n=1 Tax=Trichuris trichiura TaxID=36087 RepID=A0A077Z407_TRITR|nr:SPRY and SOCS box domain containing protein [Trichuris trichiura]
MFRYVSPFVIFFSLAPFFSQEANAWNPNDCSVNIFVKEDDCLTFHRHPVAQSTDGIRGKMGYSRGFHVWDVCWPTRQRGTHAVIGVATINAPIHTYGYCSLVGSNPFSWGWDIGRNKLYHDREHLPSQPYPVVSPDEPTFMLPQDFFMVLDMDEGTLAFCTGTQYLGVAFHSLKGKKLYPIVSAVWGHCEVTLKYVGCLQRPCSLADLCRCVIRRRLTDKNIHRLHQLNLPPMIKQYLLYQ